MAASIRRTPILTITSLAALLLSACAMNEPPRSATPRPAVPYNPPSTEMLALPSSQVTWHRVQFDMSKSELPPDAADTIRAVANALSGNPALRATIVGRADSVGGDAANMRLSQRRAAAVREALLSTGQVPAARVETKWTGERNQPVATGDQVGDERNRVVDIAVH